MDMTQNAPPSLDTIEGQTAGQGPVSATPPVLSKGGVGGNSKDARMIRRAIEERWPIPDDMRPLAVQALRRVMECGDAPARDRVAAVKALATLEAQNMAGQGERQAAGGSHVTIGQLVVNAVREIEVSPLGEGAKAITVEAAEPLKPADN